MAVPNEGTTSLAADASGRYVFSEWQGNAGFIAVRSPGIYKNVYRSASFPKDPLAIVAGAGVAIWTPASGKKVRLMGWALSVTYDTELIFYDGAAGPSGTVLLPWPKLLAGEKSIVGRELIGNGVLSGTADNALYLDVSANSSVYGVVWGIEE